MRKGMSANMKVTEDRRGRGAGMGKGSGSEMQIQLYLTKGVQNIIIATTHLI